MLRSLRWKFGVQKVPGPLTAEIESKKMEKKKAQKAAKKQREKEQREEKRQEEEEQEEKRRFLALSDREKVLRADGIKRLVNSREKDPKIYHMLNTCTIQYC